MSPAARLGFLLPWRDSRRASLWVPHPWIFKGGIHGSGRSSTLPGFFPDQPQSWGPQVSILRPGRSALLCINVLLEWFPRIYWLGPEADLPRCLLPQTLCAAARKETLKKCPPTLDCSSCSSSPWSVAGHTLLRRRHTISFASLFTSRCLWSNA